jgi:hypothetical protein
MSWIPSGESLGVEIEITSSDPLRGVVSYHSYRMRFSGYAEMSAAVEAVRQQCVSTARIGLGTTPPSGGSSHPLES